MRVCIDYRPALHQSTGVGSFVRGLTRALAEGYPDDRFVAFSASWRHRLSPPAPPVRSVDARLPVRLLDWMWHRHEWPPVERWAGALDIAHSPSPLLLPSRAKQVVTVHDCHFARHPEDVDGAVRRDYVPRFRDAVRRAAGILAVSQTTADELCELVDVEPERVQVSYNGVEAMRADSEAVAAVRRRLALERPYLLFVGRREPRKDLPTLLAAFDGLLDDGHALELLLVGPDGRDWETTLAAAPARTRDAVRVLDHQPAETLAALYTGAAALALPSRWEGFGLTALEAMSAGTPVVAARAGALPEVLGDAPAWFDAGDADGLADGYVRLLDEVERARRIAAGAERCRRYTWQSAAARTHALYERLLT